MASDYEKGFDDGYRLAQRKYEDRISAQRDARSENRQIDVDIMHQRILAIFSIIIGIYFGVLGEIVPSIMLIVIGILLIKTETDYINYKEE